ncbi:hypothetical protein GM921_10415 [Pedobacter sp. LMG 31464]|uniref:O-antigen ligase n=1 Tax=Pedobacter planticolens TaxID=2679964 RepID=A0A923DZG0_9SPHI|nr:O-antigen ligase family protein [Pedobacter planticolens]MBB2145901.1 hypothetical protein [Pedobacter planticolens]
MQKTSDFKYTFSFTAYFVYLLVIIKLVITSQNYIIFLAGLLPLALLSIVKFANIKNYRSELIKAASIIVIFICIYYFLVNYNLRQSQKALNSIIVIVMYIASSFLILRNRKLLEIKYMRNAFLFISIFIVFIPHLLITGNLKFGAFYNLIDKSLITTTTVEAPLIISILFLLSMFDAVYNKKWNTINLFSIFFSVFVLMVFSRRGFIFSSIFSLFFYHICFRLKRKFLIYLSFLMLFLPMFWEIISVYIVMLFKTDLITSIVQRNDVNEIANATGRALAWTNILSIFFTFDYKYFFGYPGGPPENLFIEVKGEIGDRYSHAHNTFLQLFLDGGYFICIIFIIMLVRAFKNYNNARALDSSNHNFYFVLVVFLFSLSATETLIRLQQFSLFIFTFALLGFNLINLKTINNNFKPSAELKV